MTTPLKAVAAGGNSAELREWVPGDFLPVSLGGTGGTTAAAARSNLGLGAAAVAAILGTVSQSGGVPTGAIFQTGSNANGEFIRFASGWQICSQLIAQASRTFAPGDVVGNAGWVFPNAFISRPRVISSFEGLSSYLFGFGHELVDATQITNIFYRYNGTVNLDARVMSINLLAVGRWFL